MRAAVLHAVGDLRIEERPIPSPGRARRSCASRSAACAARTRSSTTGACCSTVPPVMLGHEFAGVVEAVGEGVDAPPVGAAVVCGAGISCGECKPCRAGRTNLCRSYRTAGLQVDGGLAGYVVVPAGILLDVTDSGLPLDTLGLAQPMSIAVHVVSPQRTATGRGSRWSWASAASARSSRSRPPPPVRGSSPSTAARSGSARAGARRRRRAARRASRSHERLARARASSPTCSSR